MLLMENNESIIRQTYIDKVCKYLGKGKIIVLVGQRRVGKSFVLSQLCDCDVVRDGNVIYINKEDRKFDGIKTNEDLNAYVDRHLSKEKHNFILIDEVQDIVGFEHSIRSYILEPETDVVVTGSNARMLSSELSTLIGGRYKEIYIQSLSYNEFLLFHKLQDNDDSLRKYIEFGGLPGLIKTGLDETDVREYQSDICNTVLLKDVIMKNKIRNAVFLRNLVSFTADNSGKTISANSVSKYMKGQGESIAPAAIINYLSYLCESYMIHEAKRYDIRGKRLFESNSKYYFEDQGIRNSLVGTTRSEDIEKVIETVIYNHLIRLGYEVTVGQLLSSEVDFVCTRPGGERCYVQASYLIADDSTRQREFGNLSSIGDNYPKYVISMTPLVWHNDDNGITHLHLRRFLTEGMG